MNWPIRKVAKGGIPVTEATNGKGAPYMESDRGVPVTFVTKGGIPLTTGGGYLPEATALFGRMTVQPDATRKGLINTLIKSLKDGGVWSKLDALWLAAAHDAQAARRNWIADAFNLTAVSSPAFVADRGYQGDGVASYLDTGFTPSSAGGKFTLNSASFGLWSRTAAASASTTNYDMGANPSGTNRADMRARRSDGNASSYVNDGSFDGPPSPDGSGYFAALRSVAGTRRLRRNTVQLGSYAIASVALPSTSVTLLAAGGVGHGSRQIAAAFIGGGLSDAESDALYSALNTYLQAIGAA